MKRILAVFIAVLIFLPTFPAKAVSVSAKAAVLINGDTGAVIFEKNAEQRLSMASTTKIMTGLLLCENADLEETVTVEAKMLRVEGTSMGLRDGDVLTYRDLLYGLMLQSGNDAANVIAYKLGKTIDGFAKMMNEKAASLGLTNTHFETPSGLDAPEHYTTAKDLALLTKEALKNEDFAKAVSTKSITLNFGNPPLKRTFTNHNRLVRTQEGFVGVKTGFTKKSGRCLVSAFEQDEKYLIAVTLNAPNDWQDHKNLVDYGKTKVKNREVVPNKTQNLTVIGGEKDYADFSVPSEYFSLLEDEKISAEIIFPPFVYAPIKKGEKIGTVVYKKGDTVLKTVDILSSSEIKSKEYKQTFFEKIIENIKCIFLKLLEI